MTPLEFMMSPAELAVAELPVLRRVHRDLDAQIATLASQGSIHCGLEMQRLKRQKLALKDRISRLQDLATPDIIA